jgi:hypothetical protein
MPDAPDELREVDRRHVNPIIASIIDAIRAVRSQGRSTNDACRACLATLVYIRQPILKHIAHIVPRVKLRRTDSRFITITNSDPPLGRDHSERLVLSFFIRLCL